MGLKSFLVERKNMFFYSKGSFMVNTTEYYANNIRKHKFSFKLRILFIFIYKFVEKLLRLNQFKVLINVEHKNEFLET